MKFITTFTILPGAYHATIARFLEGGGAPPDGVKMIGRWHGANGMGVVISESEDPKAVYQWSAQWADLLILNVTPCLEDADAGAILAALPKR